MDTAWFCISLLLCMINLAVERRFVHTPLTYAQLIRATTPCTYPILAVVGQEQV